MFLQLTRRELKNIGTMLTLTFFFSLGPQSVKYGEPHLIPV